MAITEREFARHEIDLVLDLPEGGFTIRAVRGMVIQILENLVVNAAYWLKRQVEYEDGFMPQLAVTVDEDRRCMVVQDNGPGVPVSRKERIFQPFVTTKPSGMGKGLGLFIARDMAEYHDWSLQTESKPGGRVSVRPGEWLCSANEIDMDYAIQIIETFKASSVEKILVIDDVYDPPDFDPLFAGDLLDILSAGDSRERVSEQVLSNEDLDAAIEALNASDLDNSAISTALAALYQVFVDGRQDMVDPGDVFRTTKATALAALDPLLNLLERCSDDPKIEKGRNDGRLKRLPGSRT